MRQYIQFTVEELDQEYQDRERSRIGGPDYSEEIAEMDKRRGHKMYYASLFMFGDNESEMVVRRYGIHTEPPQPRDTPPLEWSYYVARDDGEEIVDHDMEPTEELAVLAAMKAILAHEIVPRFEEYEFEEDEEKSS